MRRDSRRGGKRQQAGVDGSRVEAILFDFNGVLLDDEADHFRAYRDLLRPMGVRFTRALYDARYLPLTDSESSARMLRDTGLPDGPAARRRFLSAKRRLFRARMRAERRTLDPGVRAAVHRLQRLGMTLVIVSGSARAEILTALRPARLRPAFRFIIAAEDVKRGKPHPEGYLRALARLRLPAERAMAVEDSPGGIRAARDAGLRVLGVSTSYRPAVLRRAGAFAVVPTLARASPFLDSSRGDGPAARFRAGTSSTRRRSGRRRGCRAPARRRCATPGWHAGPRRGW